MTILLTGAGGFLGSHVLEALLAATHDEPIHVTDSFTHNGATDRIVDAVRGRWARVEVITHDLTVPFSPARLEQLRDVDTIIHVASLCQVDQSIRQPREFVLANVASTLTMLEAARTLGVRRYIHMSTDEVYGDAEAASGHHPSSPYAASKAAQEDLCHAYRRTFGVPVQIVNSGNMLGERQSMLAFTPRLCRMVLAGEIVPIHTHGGEPGRRWYTYVGNVARYLVALALGKVPEAERHHLPGQAQLSNLELAQTVAWALGRSLTYELVEADTVRPGYDTSYPRLEDNPHWRPHVRLDEAIERTARWFAERTSWLAAA